MAARAYSIPDHFYTLLQSGTRNNGSIREEKQFVIRWNFHYRQMRKNFPFRKQSFFFIKYSVQQVVRINNSFHQNICSSLTDNAYRFACCLVRIFYMDDFYVFGILFECRIFFQNSRISDHQKLRNSFFQCAGNSIFRVRIIGTDYGNPFSMI